MKNEVAGQRERSAKDNKFGIEEIDESGHVHPEVVAYLFEDIDAERIFLIGGLDEVEKRDFLAVLGFQNRGFAVLDAFFEDSVERGA